MRWTPCLLIVAAADPCILSQAGVVDLTTKTASLFADLASVVGQGLYTEGSKLAGPAAMKEFHGKVDMAQLEFEKMKKKAMPHYTTAKTEIMKLYGQVSTAAAPHLAKLNTMLDKPLKDFATKLPAHAGLLAADTLVDKVLLLSWLVLAMTICLRILSICVGIVFSILFFPCRLCCRKRAKKDAPTKKNFPGKSQANSNGKGNPPPKKK